MTIPEEYDECIYWFSEYSWYHSDEEKDIEFELARTDDFRLVCPDDPEWDELMKTC